MSESERSNDPAARKNGASGARKASDRRRRRANPYDQVTEVWDLDWDDQAEPGDGWGRNEANGNGNGRLDKAWDAPPDRPDRERRARAKDPGRNGNGASPAPWDLDPEERAARRNGNGSNGNGMPDPAAEVLGSVWSELVGEEKHGLRDAIEKAEEEEPPEGDWREAIPEILGSEPPAEPEVDVEPDPEPEPDWSPDTDRAFGDWRTEEAEAYEPRQTARPELEAEPLPAEGDWWGPEPRAPAPPTVSFPPVEAAPEEEPERDDPGRRKRVRIKKLRLIALLIGLGLLAAVSTLFGMLMAVASDLPELAQPPQANSVLLDRNGKDLGKLTGNQNRINLKEDQIAPVMRQAIIAIEDRRFYQHEGVDLKGMARALWADLRSRDSVQGGSTIAQQFVKTSQAAQDDRTVMVKLREAALAFHLTRKWSKNRILLAYLNTVYFGAGAYGVESAARTYFGTQHPDCERALDKGAKGKRTCAEQLDAHEAALLAGMVQSPTAYDPVAHPQAAKRRRDVVLRNMLDQRYLSYPEYAAAVRKPVPTRADILPPFEDTRAPYFSSWIKQQVVDQLGGGQVGARRAFEGNLTVRTTIDLDFQQAAENAIQQWLPFKSGPRASMVALDNDSGEVLAMVGGDDYGEKPFNLATQGQRQPGSTMKPFVLAEALKQGIGPGSTWTSKKFTFQVPNSPEKFVVNNYEDNYAGVTTLGRATTFSDNSVYTQVGIKVGPKRISRLARRMGIRTPVSRNYAISLGALREGVTPLDLAHAYETFARGGKFTYGTMSPGEMSRSSRDPVPGPVGIKSITTRGSSEPITLPNGEKARNRTREKRVISPKVAGTVTSLLQSVVKQGTGTRAQIPGEFVAGKTGTTDNYGDAWFVGWTKEWTVAVWVGYPDELRQMKTEFRGEPVAGGTYPAGIWKTFVEAMLRIDKAKHPKKYEKLEKEAEPDGSVPDTTAPPPTTPAPSGDGDGTTGGQEAEGGDDTETTAPETGQPVPEQPAPEQTAPETPGTQPPAGGAQPPPGGATAPTG